MHHPVQPLGYAVTVLGDLIPPLGNPVLASDILVLGLVLLGQPYITLHPGETFPLASFYPFRLTVSNADGKSNIQADVCPFVFHCQLLLIFPPIAVTD